MHAAALILPLLAVAGCSAKKKPPASEDERPPVVARRVGIDPASWRCDVLTTPAAMSEIMAAPSREVDNTMPSPPGVPKPCTYAVEVAPGHDERWSYDLDCRDGAVKMAQILFTQYQQGSADLRSAYDDAAVGKPMVDDAGVPLTAPGAAFEVDVGRRGLDHHGQGILFVDDDAPCYVRVVGPDAARRLTLARAVAQRLTPETAPMRPRPVGGPATPTPP